MGAFLQTGDLKIKHHVYNSFLKTVKPAECRPVFLIPLRTLNALQLWCSGNELQPSRDTHAAMFTHAFTPAAAARNYSTQQRHLLTTLKGQQRIEWQEEQTKVQQKQRRGQEPRLPTPPVGFSNLGKSSFSAAEYKRKWAHIGESMWRFPVVHPALACVATVLRREIPHARYPVDPGVSPTALVFDLQPKYVTRDEGGGRRHWSFGVHKGTHFITPTSDVSESHTVNGR